MFAILLASEPQPFRIDSRKYLTQTFSTIEHIKATHVGEASVNDTGLTILARPDRAEVDIIFVHGLQGHPRKTWTRKATAIQAGGSTAAGQNNEPQKLRKPRRFSLQRRGEAHEETAPKVHEVFWPADLLPNDCPTARILTWGYDSRVSNFFRGAANKSHVHTYAKDLLYALSRERTNCLDRPLIFVAHSLGGIIVKDVLWRSSIERGHDDLVDIYKSTIAILFLGTPHRGSPWAQPAKTLERIVTASLFDTNARNIAGLMTYSSSLSICQENFMRLYEQPGRHFFVRTFQEAKGMKGTSFLHLNHKVVNEFSSSLTGGSEERMQSINDNHMNMCRFSDRDSDGYQKVVRELKVFTNRSQENPSKSSTLPLGLIPAEPETVRLVAHEQSASIPVVPESSGSPTKSNPLLPNQRARHTRGDLTNFGNGYVESDLHSLRPMAGDDPSEENQRLSRGPEDNFGMPPRSSNEYLSQTNEFIIRNLENFYHQFDSNPERSTRQMIQQATVRAKQVTDEFGLSPEVTPRLVLLALYDFVILCDDSSSMALGNRIPALQETVKNIAKLATKLEPSGISIRFLNYNQDANFDNLTSADDIELKARTVPYTGCTRLGQMLQFKVVGPITKKAKDNALLKPVIVAIITDGEPTNEPMESLSNTIFRCKRSPDIRKLGEAAVVFLLCRVGDSIKAQKFLKEIEEEERLEGMVYCSHESIDEELAVFQRAKNDARYFGWLIELFYTALDSVIR